ncbi:MAG TPA: ATP-binding cassette domain-containing protein [Symbiobacteriaceae bacterium]|nr:ATP-binding cassette domain-containing protein [Symbiobacteriaceae bacterium]
MITCEGLVKIYRASGVEVFALQGLDLQVAEGEWVAIVGNSGSGKSTLMNVLGGLDAPSAGTARVGDWDLTRLTPRRRDAYRRTVTGFVWQNSGLNLLPYLSTLENILLAMDVARRRPDAKAALELLDLVGMAAKKDALPPTCSGGEQQRAAVAVALAGRPRLLLADEPTGSLDAASAGLVMSAFRRVGEALGTTILMVTHDWGVARQAMRTVRIRDGKVATETLRGAEEVVVLDSAGRLQIPRHLLESAGIGSRVEVTLHDGDVLIRKR